ncbi:MAG: type III-B CRISPR module RAMP protein Cmr4 [Chloroflexi bacterium]|nr:type III-B CRISPR module RAMP protein Cmr4 [Chloroflexota bacterium]
MYERAAVIGFYAETPMHPGRGASVGAIDLPVQRERHLDYPMIPGSSLKGALRARARGRPGWSSAAGSLSKLTTVFGPETDHASDHAGALALTDARLLLFPVRSLHGVFAWTTSPLALTRYQRDLVAAGAIVPWQPPVVQGGHALVAPGAEVAANGAVTLEEFSYAAGDSPAVRAIADDLAATLLPDSAEYAPWQERLPRQLVVLPDDDFRDFVRTATEIVARIRIDDETGTVADGGLWYEEQIPPESLFYALALATPPRTRNGGTGLPRSAAEVLATLDDLGLDRLQLGGDETVGRGIVKVRVRRTDGVGR